MERAGLLGALLVLALGGLLLEERLLGLGELSEQTLRASLTIRAGSMELGRIDAPALRELELISGGLTVDCIESLAELWCDRRCR